MHGWTHGPLPYEHGHSQSDRIMAPASKASHSTRTAKPSKATRIETDSFGPIEVAADRYWGAQTERSRQNFRMGSDRMPMPIVRALAMVKLAAAQTNREL